MPTPTDVEHILAYRDPAHACNQGSIIALQDGSLMLGFNMERGMHHSDSGQSCFVRSSDGGRTWDAASMRVLWPWTDHGGNWDCAFGQLSDGSILVHTRVCSFIAPTALKDGSDQALGGPWPGRPERLKRQTGYAILRSDDNGETWGEPRPVNTSPIADGGLFPYTTGGSGAGHIIELADGGLLMPLHGTFSGDFTRPGGETTRCFVLRSDDRGANWEHWATVAHDPAHILGWAEPGMCRLASGRIVVLLRTNARPNRFDSLWCTYSDDDAASWERPRRTGLWGFPADVMQLQDGRVLAVYGYRKDPWGVRACISGDGITWEPADEFWVRTGGAADPSFPQYWHIAYPTVAQAPDGTVVCAYHQYSETDPPIQEMWVTRFRV